MSMASNVGHALAAVTGHCAGKCTGENDPRTQEALRALRPETGPGSYGWLARESGVCVKSVGNAVRGEQRLPASLMRALLRLRSPEEQAEIVSLWLGIPLEHRP